MSANERELVFRLRSDPAGVRAGITESERLLQQFAQRDQVRWQQLLRAEQRERQRFARERVRTTEQAARQEARAVEKELSPSFFARLGRQASESFKRNFSLPGGITGGGGASGIFGQALGVAGGNLITSAVTGTLGFITDKITGAIKTGFDFNKLKEQSLLGFEIKLKGREQAVEFFDRVSRWAIDAPMELDQTLEAVSRLMVAFKPDEAMFALDAITDAVAGQGKVAGEATEQINGIGLALQQMLLKGKVSAEETTQLAERQIKVYKYLGDEIAKTDQAFAALTDDEKVARVQEMAQKGLLNARTAVAVILRGMKEEFAGTAKRVAQETLAGIESNTSDRLAQLAGKSTSALFEQYKKFRQEFLDLLNSPIGDFGAEKLNQGGAAVSSAMDAALRVLKSGDFARLGFDAFSSLTEGVTAAGKGLYDAATGAAKQAEQGWRDPMRQHSPSETMRLLGFGAGQSLLLGFLQGTGQTAEGVRERLERLLNDPEIRAFLEAIKRAEGGAPNRVVGGGTFSDFSRHPNRVGLVTSAGPSTAAGSWQITGSTWRSAPIRALGLPDFSEQSQMLAALQLLVNTGAIEQLKAGNFAGAARLAGREWAALPGSPLPGRERSLDAFMRFYQDALTGQSGGGIPSAPSQRGFISKIDEGLYLVTAGGEVYQLMNQWPSGTQGVGTPQQMRTRIGSVSDLAGLAGNMGGMTNARALADEWAGVMERARAEHGGAVPVRVVGGLPGVVAAHGPEREAWQRRTDAAAFGEAVQKWPQYDERGRFVGFSTFGEGELPITANSTAHLKGLIGLMPALDRMPEQLGGVASAADAAAKSGARAADAFGDLPPLVKASAAEAKEAQKDFENFARDVSDAFGDALEDVLRLDFAGAGRTIATQLFGAFVSAAREQLSNSIFSAITGGGGGAGGVTSGGGGGSLFGNIFRGIGGIFTRGSGPGGTPNFNPNAGASGGTSGGGVLGGLFGGGLGSFSLRGLGTSAAPLLPLLGAQLGARSGGLLGGAGGLLLGGSAAAFLAPGLVAGLFGGASIGGIGGAAGAGLFGGASSAGLSGAALGLLTNPFTIAAGVGLVVGGFLLGRSKRRKQAERARTQLMDEAQAALKQILADVEDGIDRPGANEALRAADEIINQYLRAAEQIPDGKTRRLALKDAERLFDLKTKIVEAIRRSPQTGDGRTIVEARRGQADPFTMPNMVRPGAAPPSVTATPPASFNLPPLGLATVDAGRMPVATPSYSGAAASMPRPVPPQVIVIEHRHTFGLQDGIVEKRVEAALQPGSPHSTGLERGLESWWLRAYRDRSDVRETIKEDSYRW